MNEREKLKCIVKEKSYEKRKVILSSGVESDFYFDGKQTTLHAEGGYLTGKLFFEAIKGVPDVDGVGGMTLGADPIATATSLVSYLEGNPIPAFIIRKEPKGHGTGAWLEGRKNLPAGSRVVIVEDVVTSGGSSLKAIKRAEEEGLTVLGVVTLVDREEGGRENIEKEGYWLKSIFTKSDIIA
ncbi:MAG: orotate phosphoribosyltransferase [Geobacteraceae bacterium]|jgi:orotate phosphoribosyltransferase|nr:orotate phosphoribosyltransferase [Geobacteraceae bacterium]